MAKKRNLIGSVVAALLGAPAPKRSASAKRTGRQQEWRIHIAAPCCLPVRHQIAYAMDDLRKQFGGSVDYRVDNERVLGNIAAMNRAFERNRSTAEPFDANDYAVCVTADIVVPTQRARWVEYLLLRQRRLAIVGKLYDERNRTWAAHHDWGSLPVAWNRDANGVKPWATKGCSAAQPKLPPMAAKRHWWQRKA